MIEARRLQRSFGDGLIAEEIEDLQETWMRHVNVVLQDDVIVSAVYQALAHRHPNSRSHGRLGFPAEVVLRLLILKHVRNWSYAVLEREVRANLVYRDFTRVGAGKMPDAKTMGCWGVALGPAVIKEIHDRIVQIAQARKVVQGRFTSLPNSVGLAALPLRITSVDGSKMLTILPSLRVSPRKMRAMVWRMTC